MSDISSSAEVYATGREERVSLMDVLPLTEVELVEIDLSEDEAAPLLDSGIVPGCSLCRLRSTPSGDAVVSADGVSFAMRKETARCLWVKAPEECQLRRTLGQQEAPLYTTADKQVDPRLP